MKYRATEIGSLFLDNLDFEGILYWYETILEINKPQEKQKR